MTRGRGSAALAVRKDAPENGVNEKKTACRTSELADPEGTPAALRRRRRTHATYRNGSYLGASLDSQRVGQLTEQLLSRIYHTRAKLVVVDITGVPPMDATVADYLVQTVEASRLMGASVIITGLSSEIAQTLVRIGLDLSKVNAVGDLQSPRSPVISSRTQRKVRSSSRLLRTREDTAC
jgi:anti-anti-sigma regulatory factor